MNVVLLRGNLTRDPDLRSTSGGMPVCNGNVALNRRVKRGDDWVDEATFVDFVVWGRRGEAFAKYHSKGSSVLLQGHLQLDQWEDKNSGEPRSKVKVVVDEWEFVAGSGDSSGRSASNEAFADTDTPF